MALVAFCLYKQAEVAAVTDALRAANVGGNADDFETCLEHALESLTLEVMLTPQSKCMPNLGFYQLHSCSTLSLIWSFQIPPVLKHLDKENLHWQDLCGVNHIEVQDYIGTVNPPCYLWRALQITTVGEAIVDVGAPDGCEPLSQCK